jgi:hypothetical protein
LLRLPAVRDNAAMQTEPIKAEPPTRKRRWFQFSLRTLMIFTTIVAVYLGLVTSRARRQHQAVEALEQVNATIIYDTDETPVEANTVRDWLCGWLGRDYFDNVVSVELVDESKQGEEALAEGLASFARLREVKLRGVQLTEEG